MLEGSDSKFVFGSLSLAPLPILAARHGGAVQLTIHIPDEIIDGYGVALPPLEMGIFEAVAVDAILAALQRMADADAKKDTPAL
jgi:hypothetical protein